MSSGIEHDGTGIIAATSADTAHVSVNINGIPHLLTFKKSQFYTFGHVCDGNMTNILEDCMRVDLCYEFSATENKPYIIAVWTGEKPEHLSKSNRSCKEIYKQEASVCFVDDDYILVKCEKNNLNVVVNKDVIFRDGEPIDKYEMISLREKITVDAIPLSSARHMGALYQATCAWIGIEPRLVHRFSKCMRGTVVDLNQISSEQMDNIYGSVAVIANDLVAFADVKMERITTKVMVFRSSFNHNTTSLKEYLKVGDSVCMKIQMRPMFDGCTQWVAIEARKKTDVSVESKLGRTIKEEYGTQSRSNFDSTRVSSSTDGLVSLSRGTKRSRDVSPLKRVKKRVNLPNVLYSDPPLVGVIVPFSGRKKQKAVIHYKKHRIYIKCLGIVFIRGYPCSTHQFCGLVKSGRDTVYFEAVAINNPNNFTQELGLTHEATLVWIGEKPSFHTYASSLKPLITSLAKDRYYVGFVWKYYLPNVALILLKSHDTVVRLHMSTHDSKWEPPVAFLDDEGFVTSVYKLSDYVRFKVRNHPVFPGLSAYDVDVITYEEYASELDKSKASPGRESDRSRTISSSDSFIKEPERRATTQSSDSSGQSRGSSHGIFSRLYRQECEAADTKPFTYSPESSSDVEYITEFPVRQESSRARKRLDLREETFESPVKSCKKTVDADVTVCRIFGRSYRKEMEDCEEASLYSCGKSSPALGITDNPFSSEFCNETKTCDRFEGASDSEDSDRRPEESTNAVVKCFNLLEASANLPEGFEASSNVLRLHLHPDAQLQTLQITPKTQNIHYPRENCSDLPAESADSTVKTAHLAVKTADAPVNADSPVEPADSPRESGDMPVASAYSPAIYARLTMKTDDSPVKTADSPVKTADSPREYPVGTACSPVTCADSPVKFDSSLAELANLPGESSDSSKTFIDAVCASADSSKKSVGLPENIPASSGGSVTLSDVSVAEFGVLSELATSSREQPAVAAFVDSAALSPVKPISSRESAAVVRAETASATSKFQPHQTTSTACDLSDTPKVPGNSIATLTSQENKLYGKAVSFKKLVNVENMFLLNYQGKLEVIAHKKKGSLKIHHLFGSSYINIDDEALYALNYGKPFDNPIDRRILENENDVRFDAESSVKSDCFITKRVWLHESNRTVFESHTFAHLSNSGEKILVPKALYLGTIVDIPLPDAATAKVEDVSVLIPIESLVTTEEINKNFSTMGDYLKVGDDIVLKAKSQKHLIGGVYFKATNCWKFIKNSSDDEEGVSSSEDEDISWQNIWGHGEFFVQGRVKRRIDVYYVDFVSDRSDVTLRLEGKDEILFFVDGALTNLKEVDLEGRDIIFHIARKYSEQEIKLAKTPFYVSCAWIGKEPSPFAVLRDKLIVPKGVIQPDWRYEGIVEEFPLPMFAVCRVGTVPVLVDIRQIKTEGTFVGYEYIDLRKGDRLSLCPREKTCDGSTYLVSTHVSLSKLYGGHTVLKNMAGIVVEWPDPIGKIKATARIQVTFQLYCVHDLRSKFKTGELTGTPLWFDYIKRRMRLGCKVYFSAVKVSNHSARYRAFEVYIA